MTVSSGYEQTDDKYYLNHLVRKLQAEHGIIEITEDGTYDVGQYDTAEVSVGGGGGASNIVGGVFTTRNDTGRQDITVPYTGEGYPIECVIVPHDTSTMWDIYQSSKGVAISYLRKVDDLTKPLYNSANEDKAHLGTLYGTSGGFDGKRDIAIRYSAYPSDTTPHTFKDNMTMSIYVAPSGTIAFKTDTNYDYFVRYSE